MPFVVNIQNYILLKKKIKKEKLIYSFSLEKKYNVFFWAKLLRYFSLRIYTPNRADKSFQAQNLKENLPLLSFLYSIQDKTFFEKYDLINKQANQTITPNAEPRKHYMHFIIIQDTCE